MSVQKKESKPIVNLLVLSYNNFFHYDKFMSSLRNVSTELFRVKNGYEECMGQLGSKQFNKYVAIHIYRFNCTIKWNFNKLE